MTRGCSLYAVIFRGFRSRFRNCARSAKIAVVCNISIWMINSNENISYSCYGKVTFVPARNAHFPRCFLARALYELSGSSRLCFREIFCFLLRSVFLDLADIFAIRVRICCFEKSRLPFRFLNFRLNFTSRIYFAPASREENLLKHAKYVTRLFA